MPTPAAMVSPPLVAPVPLAAQPPSSSAAGSLVSPASARTVVAPLLPPLDDEVEEVAPELLDEELLEELAPASAAPVPASASANAGKARRKSPNESGAERKRLMRSMVTRNRGAGQRP